MLSLFSPPPRPTGRFPKFATSGLVHVSALVLAAFIGRVILPDNEQIDWSRWRVEPAPLRLAEPIFYMAPTGRGAAGAATVVAHRTERPGPVLVTPEHRPDAALPKTVPPVMHWSADAPSVPRKEIVNPGRREPAPPPQPSAPAALGPTNREATAATVNISLPPANSNPAPALPVSNGATSPIQSPDAAGSRAASFDTAAGQPVDVLALSMDRTAKRYVEIPLGLQNAPAGMPGALRGAGYPTGQSSSGGPAAVSAASASVPEIIRLQHPTNGNFDVVITRSADADTAASPAARLTGAPVYRVYLPVGDTQEWLLEFCAASKPSGLDSRFQIFVGDEGAVAPPYPLTTAIPARLSSGVRTTASVFRASITSAGSFRDIRPVAPSSASDLLIRLMNDWRFRPATRNAKPIDVEVLLIIPPRAD